MKPARLSCSRNSVITKQPEFQESVSRLYSIEKKKKKMHESKQKYDNFETQFLYNEIILLCNNIWDKAPNT